MNDLSSAINHRQTTTTTTTTTRGSIWFVFLSVDFLNVRKDLCTYSHQKRLPPMGWSPAPRIRLRRFHQFSITLPLVSVQSVSPLCAYFNKNFASEIERKQQQPTATLSLCIGDCAKRSFVRKVRSDGLEEKSSMKERERNR